MRGQGFQQAVVIDDRPLYGSAGHGRYRRNSERTWGKAKWLSRVASTHSLAPAPDSRGYDGANGGKAHMSCLTGADTPTSMADDLSSSGDAQ